MRVAMLVAIGIRLARRAAEPGGAADRMLVSRATSAGRAAT